MATTPATGTAGLYTNVPRTGDLTKETYVNRDGFDLIWRQKRLGQQMESIEGDIREIEANSNLSDTERMFAMQMAMNTWSAVSNLRTNMLKTVADTLKSIARNVA